MRFFFHVFIKTSFSEFKFKIRISDRISVVRFFVFILHLRSPINFCVLDKKSGLKLLVSIKSTKKFF